MLDLQSIRAKLTASGFVLRDQPKHNRGQGGGPAIFRRDPITVQEFVERLPDKIATKRGRKFYLSQSRLKKLYRAVEKEQGCAYRAYRTEIKGDAHEDPSDSQGMGSRFEYEVSGALTRAGEVPPELLTQSGKPSADQRRITESARIAREEVLPRLGINLNKTEAGRQFQFKCLTATPDLFDETGDWLLIDDIKYSGLLENRQAKYSPFGWVAEKLPNAWERMVQACHYTLVPWLALDGPTKGLQVRFRFIVFDSQQPGRYRVYRVEIGEARMFEHMNLVLDMAERLEAKLQGSPAKEFPRKGGLETCEGCPVAAKCSKYVRYPDIQVVRVE